MTADQRAVAVRHVAPIILAAGDSSRMGYPKALLPLGRKRFLTTILGKVEGLGFPPPLVILGRDAPQIQPLIQSVHTHVLINPDPGRGQLSSIQLGVQHLDSGCTGCLIWPVDLPAVPEDLVAKLADLFLGSGAVIALPRCGEKKGHPTIFHRVLFRELLELTPDRGAKELVQRYSQKTAVLPTTDASTIEDIDTPEDYRRLAGETLQAALERANSGQ